MIREGSYLKLCNTFLRLSVCLALGGMVTVGIICFLIGFGIHSPVGKYALYTALFLQAVCLLVNRFTDQSYKRLGTAYTPSPKMRRFRLTAELLWATGVALLMGALLLMLLGIGSTEPWIRRLTLSGLLLCPVGWLGLLMESHRRHVAILTLCQKQR